MKKIFLTLVAIIASVNMAKAQFEGPGAAPNGPTTVQEALKMNDETRVVLDGKIIKSLGDEKYIFKDATDEVMVEIDDEEWGGVKVTPENTVEIIGEVDKDRNEPTKIDVDSIKLK
ncbi:MAG: NirD/YgiW/YdeI family stress tolerance protein [Alphaproteobacteria bacterium]|nr:NirD/YgiW/YdeI family stress tolerance protein [Alphaproteobacteria bacterium]